MARGQIGQGSRTGPRCRTTPACGGPGWPQTRTGQQQPQQQSSCCWWRAGWPAAAGWATTGATWWGCGQVGGIARGGRSGEGESDGEDESGVRARVRVRVRARRRARHSAHRGRHDWRQLESEALSRHDALGHCDIHGALRRADLQLACGRTHAAHTADALFGPSPQPPSILWPSMARVGTVLA